MFPPLSLRIALRYLIARKSHAAVNIISLVSMIGVALAVAAMVVVMSVFNGFAQFTASRVTALEADLTVAPDSGKVIADSPALVARLMEIDGVERVDGTIEERAFAIHGDRQSPVVLRGVDPRSPFMSRLGSMTIDGASYIGDLQGYNMAMLSVGASNALRAAPSGDMAVRLYEPRRVGRISPANPARAFRADSVWVAGVFRSDTEQADADMMVVSIATARTLLDYSDEASMIQLTLARDASPASVKRQVEAMLPPSLSVKEPIERQAEAFRMINMEKWVTLLMLTFILLIAAFNILSTMGMLMAEKRDNMAVMRWLGAPSSLTGSIFGWLGALITLAGGVAGIVLGCGITLLQQHCGIVKMAVSDPGALALETYPVRLLAADLPVVAAITATVALAAAFVTRRVARSAML